jgi:hypothetical protein
MHLKIYPANVVCFVKSVIRIARERLHSPCLWQLHLEHLSVTVHSHIPVSEHRYWAPGGLPGGPGLLSATLHASVFFPGSQARAPVVPDFISFFPVPEVVCRAFIPRMCDQKLKDKMRLQKRKERRKEQYLS